MDSVQLYNNIEEKIYPYTNVNGIIIKKSDYNKYSNSDLYNYVNYIITEYDFATINNQSIINGGNILITGDNNNGNNGNNGNNESNINLNNYYTKSEIDALLLQKQPKLISGTNIKTLNNIALLGSGNITISGGSSGSGTNIDLSNYYTKTEVDTAVNNIKSSKQNTLVSGTNIKTINGQSLLGSGNITISGGSGGSGTSSKIDNYIQIDTTLPSIEFPEADIRLMKGSIQVLKAECNFFGGISVTTENLNQSIEFGRNAPAGATTQILTDKFITPHIESLNDHFILSQDNGFVNINAKEYIQFTTHDSADLLEINNGINYNLNIKAQGFYESSDERLKTFKDNIYIDLDKLQSIRKSYFSFNRTLNKNEIGISAQEIQKYYPEIVSEDNNGYLSVDYCKLSVIALAAIDKLYDRIKYLEYKIDNLN